MILRSLDLLLLLPPLVLLLLWLALGRMPSGRALAVAGLAVLGLTAGLFLYGTDRAISGRYTPAHLQDGRIVPGHGA